MPVECQAGGGEIVEEVVRRPLEEGLRIEAEVGQTVLDSFNIQEGARAFAEKRKPEFKQDG